jgi:hypothetical protein
MKIPQDENEKTNVGSLARRGIRLLCPGSRYVDARPRYAAPLIFFWLPSLSFLSFAPRPTDRHVSVTYTTRKVLHRRVELAGSADAEEEARSVPCKREHVTIRSHRGPKRDSIRWFPSPNSAAGALADPTLQSFPGNDCHYRAREGERERVDERSRGIGLHCDCVSVWSHWPTNCDYGRVCPSTDGSDLHRRGWWRPSNSPFSDDLRLVGTIIAGFDC